MMMMKRKCAGSQLRRYYLNHSRRLCFCLKSSVRSANKITEKIMNELPYSFGRVRQALDYNPLKGRGVNWLHFAIQI